MQTSLCTAAAVRAPLCLRRTAARRTVAVQPRRAVVAALPGAEKLTSSLPVDGEELPKWLTLTAYAVGLASQRGWLSSSFQITAPLVFTALTWYSLAWAVVNALDRTVAFDRVGNVVGPLFLAVSALGGFGGRVAPFEAAAAGFGFFLVDSLPSFQYSRYVWLATLAAAIYKNMPAQWMVAAFGLSALWRVFEAVKAKATPAPQEAAFLALAAWAFYKQAEMPVALAMMAAHIVSSALA